LARHVAPEISGARVNNRSAVDRDGALFPDPDSRAG